MKYLLILLVLVSCSKEKIIQKNSLYYFNTQKSISLPNDNNYFYAFSTQYKNNNLFRLKLRTLNKGISVTNLDTKIKKDINLTSIQEEHIKKIRGFKFKADSLFLLSNSKLMILNKNKIIYEAFFNKPELNNYFPITATNKTPPFIYKNSIYFCKILDMNPSNKLYSSNTLLKFNYLENRLTELKNTNYSKIYFDNCWINIDLERSYALKENTLLFSLPIDDSIYLYSLDTKTIIKKSLAKSKYKNKKVEPVNCDDVWNTKNYHKHVYNNYLYKDIIYDKYKDLYYRIVNLPTKDYDLSKKFNSKNIPFSIIVLNSNLEVIYESVIFNVVPKYLSFDYFVNNDGLWISSNNPDNKDYNENKLSFTLFNFTKK